MNDLIAHSAVHLAGPVAKTEPAPHLGGMLHHPFPFPFPIHPIQHSLPLASSKNGSLFVDRYDPNLHWYLPDFEFAQDVDPLFSFAASQTGQQADGTPFNVARLSFRLIKSEPADAVQFSQSNPGAKLQEIPLANLAVVFTSPYLDPSGQQQVRTFSAKSVNDQGDGSFEVVFDGSILGDSVIALYQDLRVFGKASVSLSATFQAWSTPGAPAAPTNLNIKMLAFPLVDATVMQPTMHSAVAAHGSSVNLAAIKVNSGAIIASHPISTAPQAPPPDLVQVATPFAKTLAVGLKYNVDGYQLRYTVTTNSTASRVIVSVADLNTFNTSQSQFAELKKLGNINLRYPSLNRAYIGVLSRTIVLIPQRYSIVRSKTGCAATCLARVDSSAASASKCAFEFTFVIAPEVNRLELAKLQNEITNMPDLQGYQITFPDFLRDSPPSSLFTNFKSTAQFATGSEPHTFAVTVSIQDDGSATPAVANANLFILRLCSQTGTDLIGSLSVKLDDGFTDPVPATIDLNFAHTTGTNELSAAFDSAAGLINLSNLSPLDLQIQEYGLVQGSKLTEVSDGFLLPAQSFQNLPLPTDNSGMELLPVAQLALPTPMNITAAATFLNFQTVDVQQTQYVVAIDAAGVDFGKVASISASITFPALPSISAVELKLGQNLRADSTHIIVPLANAMFTLPATVNLNVGFVDSTVNPIEFSVENDFVTEPVLSLLKTQIADHMPVTQ